jgi:organic hydroperoxide reductase OsmC/OhrA
MSALPHSYEVILSGDSSPYATLSTADIPLLRSAPPENFGGPGDAWSPEHLLLAAVESCFMFTLPCGRSGVQVRFSRA